jgi:hypothetical protein
VVLQRPAYLRAPAVPIGDDVAVVVGTGGSGGYVDTRFDVARVPPVESQPARYASVVIDPEWASDPQLALRGPDIVLAWIGSARGYPGRIGVARVSLP